MENIITLTVMDQKNIGDVLVQDIQSFINLNPITLRVGFPDFKVDNLTNIVLLFINDVIKCWEFININKQDEIKNVLMNTINTYYQEHWDKLLEWVNEQIKNSN